MPKLNTDTLVLSFHNALIMGHCPEVITLDQVANKPRKETQDVGKFGLFEAASPNYTNYYPEVTPADLVPKDEDFFTPLVRALSEVIVHKNINPVDFSKPGVLRGAMDLLYGQTVYIDHETAIGNAIGTVSELSWENGYTAKGGHVVPPGINAKLKIDGKSNPRLVRLMTMDPPGIHSFSVTVSFNWESSHPGLSPEEFYSKLGTWDKDGVMYRRVVTRINSFREISLVNHGADPFAQIIKDGQIINPKYANLVYNKADNTLGINHGIYDFKVDVISNSDKPSIPISSNNITNEITPQMKDILILLAATFQLSTDGKTDEALVAELTPRLTDYIAQNRLSQQELGSLKTSADGDKLKITELTQKITELTTQITLQPTQLQALEAYTTTLRKEALRLHIISNKNVADEGIKSLIDKAEVGILETLKNSYEKQAEELLPLTCNSCHSTNITRASAVTIPPVNKNTPMDKDKKKKEGVVSKMHG